MMNNHFMCPIPWMSLCFGPQTSLRACCHQDGSLAQEKKNWTWPEIMDLEHNRSIREKMLSNKIPEECNVCHKMEQNGCHSPRQEYLEQFLFSPLDPFSIKYLDLTVDNVCNLECAMCSPYFSYKLNDFFSSELGLPSIKKWSIDFSPEDMEKILPSLQMITLTGGETFLSRKSLSMLRSIGQTQYSKFIKLRLFSNLTIIPPEIDAILSPFKSVELFVSADATGKTYEQIRHPARWQQFLKNLEHLNQLSITNLETKLHCVISALNWNKLDELIKFYQQSSFVTKNILPTFIEIEDRKYLHPTVLPSQQFEKGRLSIMDALTELVPGSQDQSSEIENFKMLLKMISNKNFQHLYIDYLVFLSKLNKHRKKYRA